MTEYSSIWNTAKIGPEYFANKMGYIKAFLLFASRILSKLIYWWFLSALLKSNIYQLSFAPYM